MTYRGTVTNGVVVLEGAAPPEGTVVNVTPANESPAAAGSGTAANHPALGLWKDRTDLPDDPAEASGVLRARMMRRSGAAADDRVSYSFMRHRYHPAEVPMIAAPSRSHREVLQYWTDQPRHLRCPSGRAH
jgi:hypothetical protein